MDTCMRVASYYLAYFQKQIIIFTLNLVTPFLILSLSSYVSSYDQELSLPLIIVFRYKDSLRTEY